jgi:hypothetical protein
MMSRAWYIIRRLGAALLSSVSRFCNAAFLGGSTSESISARSYREPWPRTVKVLDAALWIFGKDHCCTAWRVEVDDARKTLARNDLLK